MRSGYPHKRRRASKKQIVSWRAMKGATGCAADVAALLSRWPREQNRRRYAILFLMKTSTRTYTLAIEKHPGGYLAYFPALAGCQTWGKTDEEAVTRAEEALAVYLGTLADSWRSATGRAQRQARIPRHYGESTRCIVLLRGSRVGARRR